jgi:YfiH family protein
MLQKNKKGFYTATALQDFNEIACGFSTVKFGNMKPSLGLREKALVNQKKFLKNLSINSLLVDCQQVHENNISVVDRNSIGKTIKGSDGLVTKEKNLFLTVYVADCLPILAFDPKKEICGIAHAGWRGTVGNIAKNLIASFKELGSKTGNIKIVFGPCLDFCHYEIKDNVASKFREVGLEKAILVSVSGKIYLDLREANLNQLKEAGVLSNNIALNRKFCTYEMNDFYSFRREKEELRGEIASVIGIKNDGK